MTAKRDIRLPARRLLESIQTKCEQTRNTTKNLILDYVDKPVWLTTPMPYLMEIYAFCIEVDMKIQEYMYDAQPGDEVLLSKKDIDHVDLFVRSINSSHRHLRDKYNISLTLH